jgi:hypothetical protein
MISDRCSDTNGKVLVQRVGENLLPTAQAWGLRWPGPPVAAPGTGNRHIDLFCHLIPGQAFVTQLKDLPCGGTLSTRTAATHLDPCATKLVAHRCRRGAQLRTDLAQGPAWAYKSAARLASTSATVTSDSP